MAVTREVRHPGLCQAGLAVAQGPLSGLVGKKPSDPYAEGKQQTTQSGERPVAGEVKSVLQRQAPAVLRYPARLQNRAQKQRAALCNKRAKERE